SLLAHERTADGFFAVPAVEVAAETMAEDTRSEPTAIPPAGALAAGALQPGVTLGKYIIERRLGRGGMGVVFLAYDATLERRLAIKVLGSPMEDEASRAQLMGEARSASRVNHPNICTIYEVGEENGRAFIAMEYIDGRPLRDVVDLRVLGMPAR